ncbi:hypothetical protein [Bacillus haynesii]|uniref:hypothetical protein n=1 Tax=Bacillus haynesii TaxID=1925021 RepID=UPI00227F00D1|nr:hypothetical protein [Bacillus haynesii]MCY8074908.1 hypothetical protein [Bacillus haynesii]
MLTYEFESLDSNYDVIQNFCLDEKPEKCPICNSIQDPYFVSAYRLEDDRIEAIFKCSKKSCNHLFISLLYYKRTSDLYSVVLSYPAKPIEVKFNEEVTGISPLFVEIYNEANAAESHSLKHVAGMGYRKSLEFLIKDYLIKHKGEDEETIKEAFLGKCIKQYLSDNIKQVAERATWLGNDETHYHRVWEDKDIQDLKKLIDLTVYWISSEIQTERYITEMDSRK